MTGSSLAIGHEHLAYLLGFRWIPFDDFMVLFLGVHCTYIGS